MRASPSPAPQHPRPPRTGTVAPDATMPQRAVDATTEFLEVLGIEGEILCRDRRGDEMPHLWIEVLTRASGVLIGERGRTLCALEHVLRLVLRPVVGDKVRVMVDVNAYRVRHMESLRRRARLAAQRARMTGRAALLEPMSPADRRLIHLTLATEEGVSTESQGEGAARRVVVRPRDPLV